MFAIMATIEYVDSDPAKTSRMASSDGLQPPQDPTSVYVEAILGVCWTRTSSKLKVLFLANVCSLFMSFCMTYDGCLPINNHKELTTTK